VRSHSAGDIGDSPEPRDHGARNISASPAPSSRSVPPADVGGP
jgi:hypothetical protein